MSNSREIHSQYGSEPVNDPLRSIYSGRFSNMRFNKPPTGMHWSIIGYNNFENKAHNSTVPMLLHTEACGIKANSKLDANNVHLQGSQSLFSNIKTNLKDLLTSRIFTQKSYVMFLLFLFMSLFLYGAVFSESSKWISDVLKSKAHKMSYFVIYQNYSLSDEHRLAIKKELGFLAQEAVEDKLDDIVKKVQSAHLKYRSSFEQVPLIHQSKENGEFCLIKRVSSDFCNVTEEKNKQIRISKATKKDTKQKYSAGQATMNHCDHKFILSENFMSFEKLFLDTMKKIIYNATENYSSYFFHEWLQSILAITIEDITHRLKLEFETLKDNATTTTKNFTAEAGKIIENIVKDSKKYEEKGETTVDKPIIYNKGHIVSIFQELFNEMMLRYDADKEKFVDFALKSSGGKVLSVKQTENYFERETSFSFWKRLLKFKNQPNSPEAAIQPGMEPGQCWAFKGGQGVLVIKLASKIYPTGFTIEHIPVSLSPSGLIDSAPKEFSVWGLSSENDDQGKAFGLFSYSLKGYPLQYFPVQYGFNQIFRFVELRILSNHGNSEYTCLYRFRVHGRTAKKTFENTVVF